MVKARSKVCKHLDMFELKRSVFDKVITQSLAAKAEDLLSRQRDNTLNSCLIITLLFLRSHFLVSLFHTFREVWFIPLADERGCVGKTERSIENACRT